MSSVGFEPAISAGERPQTLALAREVAGKGVLTDELIIIIIIPVKGKHI